MADEEPNSENTFDGTIYFFDEGNFDKVSYESKVEILVMMKADYDKQFLKLNLLSPKDVQA